MHNIDTNPPTAPAAPSGADDLLDKPAAANLLGISTRTLDGLMARRMVPFVKVGAKIVRFHRGDLLAHFRRHFGVSAEGGAR
jgi:excisionase family DNA binding protein